MLTRLTAGFKNVNASRRDKRETVSETPVIIFTSLLPISAVISYAKSIVLLAMNFLAHAYLSFGEKEVLVGNMVSDFVKGKAQYDFIPGIRRGIQLHRLIDDYTDTHAIVKKAKEIFRPDYRLYSAPIIDILFDHFLANDKTAFAEAGLKDFTQTVYQILEEYTAHLPMRFTTMFAYMKTEDWLLNYQERQGIERSVRGLVRRSSFLHDSTTAIALFNQHYALLQQLFDQFFTDVKIYAKEQLRRLNEAIDEATNKA